MNMERSLKTFVTKPADRDPDESFCDEFQIGDSTLF